jgi:CheY-like chemotaxis protein
MRTKSFTILAADDDMEDLELIEEALLNASPEAKLKTVATGKDVMEYLSRQPDSALPCLIILDYNMPELNGAQVLAQISREQRYADIPKVMLSTSAAPLHIHECMANGAAEYFVKPNNMHDLNALAVKMLAFCRKSDQ